MLQAIISVVAIVLSAIALALSATTAWLTLFRRGKVKMTRPTMVAFVREGESPKIVLRAMLFSTAYRGNVIENMYVNLQRENTTLTLAFWGYGETTVLQRGGGLFVGREGVAVNHHFTTLSAGHSHKFQPGPLTISVFATVLGHDEPQKLPECAIRLSEETAKTLNDKSGGVMFNWNPNSDCYQPAHTPYPIPGLQP